VLNVRPGLVGKDKGEAGELKRPRRNPRLSVPPRSQPGNRCSCLMNLGLHQCSLTLDGFTPCYWPATAPRLFKLEQNRPAKGVIMPFEAVRTLPIANDVRQRRRKLAARHRVRRRRDFAWLPSNNEAFGQRQRGFANIYRGGKGPLRLTRQVVRIAIGERAI
jgi:hypothetical protein